MTPDRPAEAPAVDLAAIRAEAVRLGVLTDLHWRDFIGRLVDALAAQAERLARAIEERDTERLAFATAKAAYAIDGERLEAEAAEQAPVVKAALAWVDEIRTWAEDVSETDQAVMDAVDEYRLALAPVDPAS